MIDRSIAERFAGEWADAWNSHDLERIFYHPSEGPEVTNPLIVERMNVMIDFQLSM